MGSVNNKARPFSTLHHQHPLCTRTHQIGALLLVAASFFLTSLLDRSFRPCASHFAAVDIFPSSRSSVQVTGGRDLLWPHRGYGPLLDLKIYVYDDSEIDGLRALMRGRDGVIDSNACLKGQWGTQATAKFKVSDEEERGSRPIFCAYVYLMRSDDGGS